jgi:hypothetical protein
MRAMSARSSSSPTVDGVSLLVSSVTSFPVAHVGFDRWALGAGDRPACVLRGLEFYGRGEVNRRTPLCRVGRSMNLRKQVEPLKQATL